MKALTVWQPYASLIVIGAKPYEFRPKRFQQYIAPPKVGERIVIHSAKKDMDRDECRELLASLDSQDNPWRLNAHVARPFLERLAAGVQLLHGYGLGTVMIGTPMRCDEIWPDGGPDQWAWPMLDPIPFESPVLARGAQGFWTWEHRTCNAIGMHMPPPPETMVS